MSHLNHIAPDRVALEANKKHEPLGEQIRGELEALLNKYQIVSILLDTDEHQVSIDSAKLPPNIKPVLTHWGSIYVKDEAEIDHFRANKEESG